METKPTTVVELTSFIRSAGRVWDDDERGEFIDYIARNPDAGVIVPATGGLRKVRWGRPGSGKRGGVRVIYFYYDVDNLLFLLALYAKAERGDLSQDEKKIFVELVAEMKRGLRH